jgi:hypothetical protein
MQLSSMRLEFLAWYPPSVTEKRAAVPNYGELVWLDELHLTGTNTPSFGWTSPRLPARCLLPELQELFSRSVLSQPHLFYPGMKISFPWFPHRLRAVKVFMVPKGISPSPLSKKFILDCITWPETTALSASGSKKILSKRRIHLAK